MTARELVVVGRRFTRRRRGLLDHRPHPPRGRHRRHPARAVHAADGARQRRRDPRRRVHRRPDRGRARRARRQGRARRRGDEADVPPRRRGAVRRRVQAHGDVPRDGRRRRRTVVRCFVKGAPDVLLARSVPLPGRGRLVACRWTTDRDRVARRERPAGRRGPARARRRPPRLRPRHVRSERATCWRWSPTWSCSRSSASSTRPARRPRTPSPCARTPASASA